jgi:hypothetical protein
MVLHPFDETGIERDADGIKPVLRQETEWGPARR